MANKSENKTKKLMQRMEYLLLLLKKLRLTIIILCLVGGIMGFAVSNVLHTPEYTVTRAFTISVDQHPGANSATINANQLSKTIPSLLSSNIFIEHMDPYLEADGITGKFKVTSLEYSNIFYLTVVSDHNDSCFKIIEHIEKHYNEVAKGVIGDSTMKYLAPPSYNNLPSNAPNYALSVLFGMIFVFAFICLALFIMVKYTETVTSADDLGNEINAPCLATVHQAYHKKRSGQAKDEKYNIPLVTDENANLEFCREISTLSAKFDKYCRLKNCKSVLVTSTISGEGKSSISLNLACDLADKGKRVVIIDCDLRMPCIARNLGIDNIDVSLSDALASPEKDCVIKTAVDNLYFVGNSENIYAPLDSTNPKQLKALIDRLKAEFDYIIVDTPPSSFLGDAIEIGEITDGFIYVVSYNSMSKNYILRSLSAFDEARCKMIGFVLNHKAK